MSTDQICFFRVATKQLLGKVLVPFMMRTRSEGQNTSVANYVGVHITVRHP